MIAEMVVAAGVIYAVAGALFGLAFVSLGIGRVDPAAADTSLGFRLLVLPGVTAIWPLLAWRWARGLPPPEEHGPHRRRAAP